MHAYTHMHVKHDKHGCLHVGGHLQFLYMYTCLCMCVCVYMCTCLGIPPCPYKARHAHKRLYTVLPKYSKIQVLPGITSCRLVKDNKQAIELNSLLLNNMPKDGYG